LSDCVVSFPHSDSTSEKSTVATDSFAKVTRQVLVLSSVWVSWVRSSPLFITDRESGLQSLVISRVLLLRGCLLSPYGWGEGFTLPTVKETVGRSSWVSMFSVTCWGWLIERVSVHKNTFLLKPSHSTNFPSLFCTTFETSSISGTVDAIVVLFMVFVLLLML
jgi:hypothetical protein